MNTILASRPTGTDEWQCGPRLIHAIADRVRAGRPIGRAIAIVLVDEHRPRYINLIADLCTELGLTEPVSNVDLDHLPQANARYSWDRLDHPASYATRLYIWAARLHNATAAADALDGVAHRMARELAAGGLR